TPRGWDFTITQAISVEQLGVNAGIDGMTITLSLWDVTTQSLLAQTSATSAAFGWVFADISPLILTPGDTYSVIGWADTTNTGIPWYIFNNNPPPAFNPTGTVNYLNTRFDNGIGANDFPTQIIGAPAQYGVTDIGYELVATPEPASFMLVGSALAFVFRKRFQK
ncbi:MAG: PEP-CTERM sorting domain-containing protein, partial [Terriglobales bacterium]